LISTTAVCAVVLSVLGVLRESANQARKMKKASQDRRTKVFQRRVAFCSLQRGESELFKRCALPARRCVGS
jgi:hypothetical protein